MSIDNSEIEIATGDGPMAGYLARPRGDGPWPGVMLFMEIFGVNGHIRSVADRLAAEGYVVLAPDLFHRAAPGAQLGYDARGLQRGIELVSALTGENILADLRATYRALQERPEVGGKGIGAIGFCFGGHLAYRAACELPLAATVSFYGGGMTTPRSEREPATVDRTSDMRGRTLCLFGKKDGYIPATDVAAIRDALAAHGGDHEVVVYPGVGHGFFCDERDDFDAATAADAWQRLTGLFAAELPGG